MAKEGILRPAIWVVTSVSPAGVDLAGDRERALGGQGEGGGEQNRGGKGGVAHRRAWISGVDYVCPAGGFHRAQPARGDWSNPGWPSGS